MDLLPPKAVPLLAPPVPVRAGKQATHYQQFYTPIANNPYEGNYGAVYHEYHTINMYLPGAVLPHLAAIMQFISC